MTRARILLADDHPAVRKMVSSLLHNEFEVVGEAADGREMLSEAGRLQPDVVVLDISMPLLDGIAAAIQLRASESKAKIVFLTVQGRPEFVRAGLAAGALGYVIKSHMTIDLVTAIHEALANREFVSPSLFSHHAHPGKDAPK